MLLILSLCCCHAQGPSTLARTVFSCCRLPLQVDILVEETRFSSFPGVDSVDGVTKESFVELYGLDDPDSFPFLKDNRLYRIDGVVSASDGLDWWERGVSRPDIVSAGPPAQARVHMHPCMRVRERLSACVSLDCGRARTHAIYRHAHNHQACCVFRVIQMGNTVNVSAYFKCP